MTELERKLQDCAKVAGCTLKLFVPLKPGKTSVYQFDDGEEIARVSGYSGTATLLAAGDMLGCLDDEYVRYQDLKKYFKTDDDWLAFVSNRSEIVCVNNRFFDIMINDNGILNQVDFCTVADFDFIEDALVYLIAAVSEHFE